MTDSSISPENSDPAANCPLPGLGHATKLTAKGARPQRVGMIPVNRAFPDNKAWIARSRLEIDLEQDFGRSLVVERVCVHRRDRS